MREALRKGADVAGGGPLDPDYRAHVAQVFALAREAGAAVDIHADLAIDGLRPPAEWEATLIAEMTRAAGLQGRVAIGHFAAAGAVPWEAVAPVARKLAEAGVSVAALPASELYRQGLADPVNSRRGMTRIRELLAAGLNVVIASNNVRDAFVTLGNADLLEQALLAAHAAFLDTEAELTTVLEMVTTRPARLLGLHHRSEVAVGQQADLVVLDAASPAEAIARQAEKLYVIRRGRVAARNPWCDMTARAVNFHRFAERQNTWFVVCVVLATIIVLHAFHYDYSDAYVHSAARRTSGDLGGRGKAEMGGEGQAEPAVPAC